MSEKLFLLDFDGVLVDSLDFYARVVGATLDKIGTPIVRSREDYISLFEGNFYDCLKQRGVDLDAFIQAGREIRAKADYGSIKPQPGWNPVLETLSRSHPLTIISSNDSSTIKAMLKRFEWNIYFGEIFGSDYLYSKKGKLITALQKISMKPDQAYYVGDTIGDIK
jgi:phosphoglycolate phosphatase